MALVAVMGVTVPLNRAQTRLPVTVMADLSEGAMTMGTVLTVSALSIALPVVPMISMGRVLEAAVKTSETTTPLGCEP